MNLTKKQTEEVLSKFLTKENGLNEVLQMMLNAMIRCERTEHLANTEFNKANGYRFGKVFGFGSQIWTLPNRILWWESKSTPLLSPNLVTGWGFLFVDISVTLFFLIFLSPD